MSSYMYRNKLWNFGCYSDRYKSGTDQLVIECRVRAHPTPNVAWTRDNQPIPPTCRYQQSVLTDGTCQLIIHGPESRDSGLYKCTAKNSVHTEHTSGYVLFEG